MSVELDLTALISAAREARRIRDALPSDGLRGSAEYDAWLEAQWTYLAALDAVRARLHEEITR